MTRWPLLGVVVAAVLGCAEEPSNPVVPDDGVTQVLPAQLTRADPIVVPDGGVHGADLSGVTCGQERY